MSRELVAPSTMKLPVVAGDRILAREVSFVDQAAQSETILAPVMYRLSGDNDYDRAFIAQVVRVGEGESRGGHPERFVVEAGDILVMNLSNVSYRLHLGGLPFWMVQNRFIAGTLNPKDWSVQPQQHFCLVKANPDRRQALITGGGRIILSDGDASSTDHIQHGLKADYGEVVAVGPGRWIDGDFVKPPCKPGDGILYDMSHSTLPLLIRGEAMTLVAAHQVLLVEPSDEPPPTVRAVAA
jgi:co-chaperonin GroES (HSP10)